MNETTPSLVGRTAEAAIRVYIEQELLQPGIVVENDQDLLSGDLLDSVSVLRLGSWIEETFGISVRTSDYVVENFQSIAALTSYVARRVVDKGATSRATDDETRATTNKVPLESP